MKTASRIPKVATYALEAGDAIGRVSLSRWDLEGLRNGRSQSRIRFGGWLDNVAQLDTLLFGISTPEAELMDPQQRVLLEVWTPC